MKKYLPFLLIFVGAVLYGDTFTFRADRMSGSRAAGREVMVLTGNAEVRADNMLLRADRIEIHGNDNEFIDCIGNVWGFDQEKDIVFQSDRLRYDRTMKIARLEGNAIMEDRGNEVVARSRFIEYNDRTEIAILQVAVRLFRDTIVCRAEYAVFHRGEMLLDLSGFPVVFKNNDEFRATRIRVNLDTEDVILEGDVSGSIISGN